MQVFVFNRMKGGGTSVENRQIEDIYCFMTGPFRKLALAIAFSPRIQALLAETARLKFLWNAELCLIHVGSAGPADEERLNNYLTRSEEHTSELQSRENLVCRLLLEK